MSSILAAGLGIACFKDEVMELTRLLVEKIDLAPKEKGGPDAALHGDLARILALCSTGAEGGEAEVRNPCGTP